MKGTKKESSPKPTNVEFKNHDQIVEANDEVYKRRFLNAMIQGAAKKCNHMFHMVDDELTDIEPLLTNKYSKLMASADYMYYIIPNMEEGINGGVVHVQFPTKDNPKAIIHVQAMVFPVLIHELIKGVMELLSAHGLPKDKKIGKFVIDKADFLGAEPWDMRIGPALWSRFTDAIDADDFKLKHHIYTELCSLPVKEFNMKMREIMGGTKDGKQIIKDIVSEVKSGLEADELNEVLGEIDDYGVENSDGNSDGYVFDLEDLISMNNNGDSDGDSDGNSDGNSDSDEGWDFEQLF